MKRVTAVGGERPVSEETYRELFETMPVMYFEMDERGDVLAVNEFGAEQLGYRADELIGRSVLDVFHEDDRASVAEQFRSIVAAADGELVSWEFRKRRRDHSVLWVRETARSMRTEDGRTVVRVVCQDITERKLAEEARAQAEREVRRLSLQLGEAQERERRRIAVHLHDDVGQTLTAASLLLARIAPEDRGAATRAPAPELYELKALIQRAMQDTRSLSFELASPVLYELGLAEAIRGLCEEPLEGCGTQLLFDVADDGTEVPQRVAVPLFRIAAELVYNVCRHARADRARVALRIRGGHVELKVEDDGRGFDPAAVRTANGRKGVGLFGIEQRVEQLGGRLEIRSAAGTGTRVLVAVDVAPPAS